MILVGAGFIIVFDNCKSFEIHIVFPQDVGPAISKVNGCWRITFDCWCWCGEGGGGGGGGGRRGDDSRNPGTLGTPETPGIECLFLILLTTFDFVLKCPHGVYILSWWLPHRNLAKAILCLFHEITSTDNVYLNWQLIWWKFWQSWYFRMPLLII